MKGEREREHYMPQLSSLEKPQTNWLIKNFLNCLTEQSVERSLCSRDAAWRLYFVENSKHNLHSARDIISHVWSTHRHQVESEFVVPTYNKYLVVEIQRSSRRHWNAHYHAPVIIDVRCKARTFKPNRIQTSCGLQLNERLSEWRTRMCTSPHVNCCSWKGFVDKGMPWRHHQTQSRRSWGLLKRTEDMWSEWFVKTRRESI